MMQCYGGPYDGALAQDEKGVPWTQEEMAVIVDLNLDGKRAYAHYKRIGEKYVYQKTYLKLEVQE